MRRHLGVGSVELRVVEAGLDAYSRGLTGLNPRPPGRRTMSAADGLSESVRTPIRSEGQCTKGFRSAALIPIIPAVKNDLRNAEFLQRSSSRHMRRQMIWSMLLTTSRREALDGLVSEIMRHAVDAASDGLQLCHIDSFFAFRDGLERARSRDVRPLIPILPSNLVFRLRLRGFFCSSPEGLNQPLESCLEESCARSPQQPDSASVSARFPLQRFYDIAASESLGRRS